MKCPYCQAGESKVIDSRGSKDNSIIRRRRECSKCGRRFTTYERVEELMPTVIKKDGRRELFDRQKIIVGLLKACEKRPISRETIEGIVTEIEREIQSLMRSEIPSSLIGEKVMARLHDLDDVAYVRFASVYRQFKGLDEFMEELKKLHPKRAKEKE